MSSCGAWRRRAIDKEANCECVQYAGANEMQGWATCGLGKELATSGRKKASRLRKVAQDSFAWKDLSNRNRLAQCKERWRFLLNTVMNCQVT